MKRPLTGLVVTYASGIWIGSLVDWALTPLLLTSAGCLILFLLLRRTPLARIVLFAAVFVLGIAGYRQATTISSPIDITRLLELRDQSVNLQGVIVTDTGARDTPASETDSERLRFSLELRAVQRNGEWVPAMGTVLVFVSDAREVAPLRYGDLIRFSGVLRVPVEARNPGAFDWRGWLEQRRIHFTATIRKDDALNVEAHDRGNPMIATSLRLSRYLERSLHLGLEDERALGVLFWLLSPGRQVHRIGRLARCGFGLGLDFSLCFGVSGRSCAGCRGLRRVREHALGRQQHVVLICRRSNWWRSIGLGSGCRMGRC